MSSSADKSLSSLDLSQGHGLDHLPEEVAELVIAQVAVGVHEALLDHLVLGLQLQRAKLQ